MVATDAALREAAMVAMRDVIRLRAQETVLIVTNPAGDVLDISMALYAATAELGGSPALAVQPVKTQLDLAEAAVIGALRTEPDVMVSISAEKLGKDESALRTPYVTGERTYNHVFNYLLGEKISRAFWSPGVTREMFVRTVPIDYATMRRRCAALNVRLSEAASARVTAPGGTDLSVGLEGREARSDDGDFSEKGKGGNLPAGETFISPANGTCEGTIAFDGCMSLPDGEVIPRSPIVCAVRAGFVRDIAGGLEADMLRKALERASRMPHDLARDGKLPAAEADGYARNAYHIGEFGIGLNPAAAIVGNMLEDEKVFRTCHFALGSNYDEDAKALTHLDGLVKEPTVELTYPDGRTEVVMRDGQLLF